MTLKTVRALALLPAPPFRSVINLDTQNARIIINKRGENVLDLSNVSDVIPDPRAHAEHEVGRMVEARATFAAFAKVPELLAALDGILETASGSVDGCPEKGSIEYARRILDETITAMMPEGGAVIDRLGRHVEIRVTRSGDA